MGKSLSSERARARSQKQQKQASRHAAPDARERIPMRRAAPDCAVAIFKHSCYRRRRSGSVLSFLRCISTIQL